MIRELLAAITPVLDSNNSRLLKWDGVGSEIASGSNALLRPYNSYPVSQATIQPPLLFHPEGVEAGFLKTEAYSYRLLLQLGKVGFSFPFQLCL